MIRRPSGTRELGGPLRIAGGSGARVRQRLPRRAAARYCSDAMQSELLAALADSTRWVAEATRLLSSLGFLVVADEHAPARSDSFLLAALRAQPTLHHFDPEEISYWVADQGRGRRARLDLETAAPPESSYSWGLIRLADRLGVRNEFLSFGGKLRVRPLDATTTAVAFASPAPILRLAGHSQGLDPLSPEVGSFLGRLKVPIDFIPGAEARIAAAPPAVLYAAFVQDLRDRFGHSEALRDAHQGFAAWAPREAARLEAASGTDWRAALDLRQELGLARH